MEDILLAVLSKEGVATVGLALLIVYTLKTSNDRELRYIGIIDKFSDRFDNLEDKVESNQMNVKDNLEIINFKVDSIAKEVTRKHS